MKFRAIHRYADQSPRKIRVFANMVRGKTADEALQALKFFPNKGARLLEQVIRSAVGNAKDNGTRDVEELIVTESRVDGAPFLKRIQPRARGTAFPIKRRYSHIYITLEDQDLGGND